MAKGRVQPQSKVQDEKYNYRLNREITSPRIRLVGENFDEVSEVAKKLIVQMQIHLFVKLLTIKSSFTIARKKKRN